MILLLLLPHPVSAEDQCKLYCRVEYSSAYYLLASAVADGTSCGRDTFHKVHKIIFDKLQFFLTNPSALLGSVYPQVATTDSALTQF